MVLPRKHSSLERKIEAALVCEALHNLEKLSTESLHVLLAGNLRSPEEPCKPAPARPAGFVPVRLPVAAIENEVEANLFVEAKEKPNRRREEPKAIGDTEPLAIWFPSSRVHDQSLRPSGAGEWQNVRNYVNLSAALRELRVNVEKYPVCASHTGADTTDFHTSIFLALPRSSLRKVFFA